MIAEKLILEKKKKSSTRKKNHQPEKKKNYQLCKKRMYTCTATTLWNIFKHQFVQLETWKPVAGTLIQYLLDGITDYSTHINK